MLPWVHFVPLDDPSKADELLQWMKANEAACLQIVSNANAWMRDLVDDLFDLMGPVIRFAQTETIEVDRALPRLHPVPPQPKHSDLATTSAPQRLVDAVAIATSHLNASAFTELNCPHAQQVGHRISKHTHNLVGNLCEPWMVRSTLMVLDYYLTPRMRGLEWSAGSSSFWLLRRLAHLYSVEHNAGWARDLKETLGRQLAHLAPKWTLAVVSCEDLSPGACAENAGQGEGPSTNYSRYVQAPAARFRDAFPFDYVSVDGRARDECLAEATQHHTPMLAAYGLLVLDNSDRPYRPLVPPHWPCVSFRTPVDETTLWMKCPLHDAECETARLQIEQMMRTLPPAMVGSRCGL